MNRLIIVLTFVLFVNISCDSLNKFTKFTLAYTTEVTVLASTGISLPIDLITPDMETNSESEFTLNNTNAELVEEILLQSLEIELTEPQNGDFSFLKSATVYMNATGLPEIEIADINNIPDNVGNTLLFDVSDKNLKDYLSQEKFSLRVQTITDELLTQNHTFQVNATFFVNALTL